MKRFKAIGLRPATELKVGQAVTNWDGPKEIVAIADYDGLRSVLLEDGSHRNYETAPMMTDVTIYVEG